MEVELIITERQASNFREKLSRIIRNVNLIKKGKENVSNTGKCRMEIIQECAIEIDNELKALS